MKSIRLSILPAMMSGAFLAVASAAPVSATVISFDDISVATGDFIPISSPYQGFNWSSSFYVQNENVRLGAPGYINGIVSPTNAAFNAAGVAISFGTATG